MKDNQEQPELDAFGETLKKVQKPRLDEAKKLALKSRIKAQLEAPLVQSLQEQGAKFIVGADVRARIKDNVFALIEKVQQKKFIFTNFFLFQKKFVAAAALFFVSFYTFFFMSASTNVVYAHQFTTLNSFSGDVRIERDGELVEMEEGMELYEKDRVVTGADGEVTVRFFDDSVSRLSSETEIVIDVLYRPDENSAGSYVEIDLIDGNVWSKVLNLVEKRSSFVVQSTDVFTATKKAAFNVEMIEGEVEVDVYKNVVEVVTPKEIETVVSGQKAILNDDNVVEVEKIDMEEKSSEWVTANLNDDKDYVAEFGERALAAKIEGSGFEIDDDYEAGNSMMENTLLFLTFDDVKRQKMELDLAEKDLVAAEIKLNDENLSYADRTEIDSVLIAYSDAVVDYVNFVEEVRVTDYEYAEELEQYLEDKILTQKKGLITVMPNAPTYDVKEVVDDLEILVASDMQHEIMVISEQEFSRLSDLEGALEQGDTELAEQIVDDYKEGVDNVISVIDSLDEGDADLKQELINDVKDGMELLDEIEEVGGEGIVSDKEIAEIVVEFDEVSIEREVMEEIKDDEVFVQVEYGVVVDYYKPLPPLLVQ